jgi:hypothetical protein
MDSTQCEQTPLMLRFAQPAPVISPDYRYDTEMEVNVFTDASGNVSPAVEGSHAGALTKTVTAVPGGGEDR